MHLLYEYLDKETLLDIGVNNLYKLAGENGLQVQEIKEGCFALFLDGNFEASLILLDELWEDTLKQFITDDFAVVIPARDILAFCSVSNNRGIEQIKNVISRFGKMVIIY